MNSVPVDPKAETVPADVERVARAICWKCGMDPNLTLGGDGQNFLWMEYEGQARAAIGAMSLHMAGLAEAVSASPPNGDRIPK